MTEVEASFDEWPAGDRIAGIRVDHVRLPLRRPVSFSTRRLTSRDFVIIRVETDDGIVGVGYTYSGRVTAVAAEELAPLLLGRPAGAIEAHWARMYQEALLTGRRGAIIRAISAIDIALWDVLAKRAGLPLYRLLGGFRTKVPAYFSGGYHREGEDVVAAVTAEAQRAVAAGYDAMKIKVGFVGLEEDLCRIGAAREVLGPHRRLGLDANNAWPTATEALPHIRAMEAFDPWWIEEPLSPDDIHGHARLAAELAVPVATGEIEATRGGFLALIQADSADILQPDACVLGGVTEWLKVVSLAATHGVPIAPHWNADIHTQLAAATPHCMVVEYFDVDEDVYNFDLVLAEHLRVTDGQIHVPQEPGVGIVLDDAAVTRYRVNGS
jgi:L-alanine-DL-glutamate epimerase-like enolase superfamily enzyme